MRITCHSRNRSDRDIPLWIAIYTSILFVGPNHPNPHRHVVAASIATFTIILAAGVVAWSYCRTRRAA